VRLELVEPLPPDLPVPLHPLDGAVQGLGLEATGAELGVAATRDQSGPLEHLQMPRDGLQADLERGGQLVHRGLAFGQTTEDGPTGGVGQSGERRTEWVDGL